MERIRQDFEDKETPAVVITDNFKGQITLSVNQLLDANDNSCVPPTPRYYRSFTAYGFNSEQTSKGIY